MTTPAAAALLLVLFFALLREEIPIGLALQHGPSVLAAELMLRWLRRQAPHWLPKPHSQAASVCWVEHKRTCFLMPRRAANPFSCWLLFACFAAPAA